MKYQNIQKNNQGKHTDTFNIENAKSVWNMNPQSNFYSLMVGPLVILFASVKRQIDQGSSKSGRFFGRPLMSPFLAFFCLVIATWPKSWWIMWDRFYFDRVQTLETIMFLFLWRLTLTISFWRWSKNFWFLYGDFQEQPWGSTKSECSRDSDLNFWKLT